MHPQSCRYSIFAEELTQRPIAECAAAFAEADAWFNACQGGDVQPDEMLIIADQVLWTRLVIPSNSSVRHTAIAPYTTAGIAALLSGIALLHLNAATAP